MLTPGDEAPDFTLPDQDGRPFHLAERIAAGPGWHLVYFYPKADTPGCTTQACGLRDILGEIGGTTVVGISPDPPARQKRFDEKHSLGFPLLSDEDHAVAEAYGAWGERSMYGRKYMGIIRSAFLVDEHGRLVAAWPRISPKDTPTKLLRALAT
ncbi:MAG TPA: thioredoxin-dependent thiol peroxidase [Acidimicrobiales bacterium]|nr:thioredoxin-dependent thiol peroxidase [Acidimicrobiales bacterium]